MKINNPKQIIQKSIEDSVGLTSYALTLNLFNVVLSFLMFVRNTKIFIKDLDKLADIKVPEDCIL